MMNQTDHYRKGKINCINERRIRWEIMIEQMPCEQKHVTV